MHTAGVHIGVVIPAFNASPWLGDAVRSVLAQTHRDWTLVVVNDGSTDDTCEVVTGFGDWRIRLIRQPNAGVSAARNRGLDELYGPSVTMHESVRGRGEAVLFLDADDWLAPDALARLALGLDASPHAVAVSGPYAFVPAGAPAGATRTPPSGELLDRLLVRNLFANGGHLLLRGDAVCAAGGFRSDLSYGEDWEFWVRIALLGPFVAAPGREPVLFVRERAGGAYRRRATDPAEYSPCLEAIYSNPALLARFGPARLAAFQGRTEAEMAWVIGREHIRRGRQQSGRAWLWRSFRRAPSGKRAVLLLAACLLPHGPYARYAATTGENFA